MENKLIEIERKFLLKGDFKPYVSEKHIIKQGYICSDGKKTVRVRLKDEKGFLTIKGPSNASGFSRFEWEKEISATDAEQLMELCEKGMIHKTRYIVPFNGKNFEVDEFYGANEGLFIAELELERENEEFEKPDWLGREVTGDVHYYNAYLSTHPYSQWNK